MDRNLWVSTLLILLYLTTYISAEMKPGNVTLHIWEGNVTVTWDPPQGNPGDYLYQVQMSRYVDSPAEWENVSHCNLFQSTICNIGHLSVQSNVRVRVGVFTTQNRIFWSTKRYINIRRSQLYAPIFTLSSTPFSVRVKIQRKQTLHEIFSYEVQYTAYLWPKGQENQTQTLTMTNYNTDDDDGQMIFSSLKSLQEYCVLVNVKSTTSSTNSSVHCIKLPLDATLLICFILLGLFCITASLILFICFLRRPRKMPSALNLFVNVWKPMIIKSDEVETVTDKGWTFITNIKQMAEFPEEDKERRESLDSGVSIDHLQLSDSSVKTEEHIEDVQMDSGCESLKETVVTRQFSTRELHPGAKNEGTEDSGLGLVHHEFSGFLEGEDTALLSKVVVGDGYRSQSPSSVDVQNELDSNMAAPSAGYRSGQVTCTCSDHEFCIWCKCKNPKPQTDTGQTDDVITVGSRYKIKSLMQTVNLLHIGDTETEPTLSDRNCNDSSLNLSSCSPLLQKEPKQDGFMTFTLDTMELTFS